MTMARTTFGPTNRQFEEGKTCVSTWISTTHHAYAYAPFKRCAASVQKEDMFIAGVLIVAHEEIRGVEFRRSLRNSIRYSNRRNAPPEPLFWRNSTRKSAAVVANAII